jgi:transposase
MAHDKLISGSPLNSTPLEDTGLLESGITVLTQEPRRRRYDEAFRRQALRIWRSSGRSAESVAKELAVSVPTLYYWAKDRKPGAEEAETPSDDIAALRSENERLRAENGKLQRQKQILRRALGIMSENLKTPAEALVIG